MASVELTGEGRKKFIDELTFFAGEHAQGSERRLALEALLGRWGQADRDPLKGSDIVEDVAALPCEPAIRMSLDVKVRECFGRYYMQYAAQADAPAAKDASARSA